MCINLCTCETKTEVEALNETIQDSNSSGMPLQMTKRQARIRSISSTSVEKNSCHEMHYKTLLRERNGDASLIKRFNCTNPSQHKILLLPYPNSVPAYVLFNYSKKENKIFSAYVYTRCSNIAVNFKVWALGMRTSNGRNTTGRPQVLGRSVREFVHPISIGFTGRYHVSNHKSRSRSGWVKKSSPYLFFNRCYMYPEKKNVNSLNSRK